MKFNLEKFKVDIPDNEYDVVIGSELTNDIASLLASVTQNRKVLIVTDGYFANSYAEKLCLALKAGGFFVHVFVMKGGKKSKSFSELLKIFGLLEQNDFARDSTLIALGGGVIGDLAGFAASTWYRGMLLLHVPTTLLAMVDSSIGGKVAINYRETINAVGNYYHPVSNLMDIDLLTTLPQRDYVAGLAEVIKCALIADADFVDYLHKNKAFILARRYPEMVFCIKRAIEIKVDHIRYDIKEGNKRLLLNYGHTLGHAIEMATQTEAGETFRHGEGVSIGMSAVLHISEDFLSVPTDVVAKARALLLHFGLPISFSASEKGYNRNELINNCMKLILKDKKRKDNQLRFILIKAIGHASVHVGVTEKQIRRAFEFVIKE